MGIIFGKKKQSRISEQDRAILQLKQQRDKLILYQNRIELALSKERDLAKALLKDGKTDKAKLLLRKKRYQEQLLRQTDGQLENLERLTHDLEYSQVELQVVEGLRQGNDALKKVNDILDLKDIEKLLDETREGVEKQREIDTLISGVLTEEDEAEIELELTGIIEKSLPDVPSESIADSDNVSESLTDETATPVKEKVKAKRSEAVLVEA
ncbi:hypothetical protein FQR65_LT15442 [Abscondita terminalis]|nr:hypothetical protein FQR65_LT15442 [Abscondita terminalis]